jgi:hypothetical protein
VTRALVVALLAACGHADAPPPAPTPVDEPKPVAPAAVPVPPPEPLPAHGVPNSAIESVPRKDWPCRFVEAIDDTTIASEFEYGARTHCWIPADLAGSRGLVGCADRKVAHNLENKVEMPEIYAYDATDHLVMITTIAAKLVYTWDGNLVQSRAIGSKHRSGFTSDGTTTQIKDQSDNVETIELDKTGHVVHYTRGGSSSTTYRWKGTRLVGLAAIGTTRIEFDCRKPAHR